MFYKEDFGSLFLIRKSSQIHLDLNKMLHESGEWDMNKYTKLHSIFLSIF